MSLQNRCLVIGFIDYPIRDPVLDEFCGRDLTALIVSVRRLSTSGEFERIKNLQRTEILNSQGYLQAGSISFVTSLAAVDLGEDFSR